MAKQFNPRTILRKISNSLLEPFFDLHGGLDGVAWSELRETQVEPVFEAWQQMPDTERKHVQVILQDINELADDRGVQVLTDELQRSMSDQMHEFAALASMADRAMWVYLHARGAFATAAYFARADAHASGRYWIKRNSLPPQPLAVTTEHRSALEAALTEFYWRNQMRGRYCAVEHYTRINGSEYFFAFLDDYPDAHIVFEEDGEPVRREERRAFDNVFVFNPDDGSLEMYAKGGKKVYEPLQQVFCQSVLGLDVGPADPLRPAYTLDHLLRPNRSMPTDPNDRISAVLITRVRLCPIDRPRESIELCIDPRRGEHGIDDAIAEYLNTSRLSLDRVRVRKMSFRLEFPHDVRRWPLSFTVSHPNTCDLKSRPDELRAIGERCLRLWEVTDA